MSTDEQWNDWFKHVRLVFFIHNTSYNSEVRYSPIVYFRGREPIELLDLGFNNTLIEQFSPSSVNVCALQDAMNKNFSEKILKMSEMYNENRAQYDCQAEAKPLALSSYCLLSNTKLITQSNFASKWLQI